MVKSSREREIGVKRSIYGVWLPSVIEVLWATVVQMLTLTHQNPPELSRDIPPHSMISCSGCNPCQVKNTCILLVALSWSVPSNPGCPCHTKHPLGKPLWEVLLDGIANSSTDSVFPGRSTLDGQEGGIVYTDIAVSQTCFQHSSLPFLCPATTGWEYQPLNWTSR